MKQKTRYDSKEKKYYVKPKKKIKLNSKFKVAVLACVAILLCASSIYLINKSMDSGIKEVNYNEIGNVDYKVYLKDNNYYSQKYLDKGMKYIANLINTININFNYEMHLTDNINYLYKYRVDAKLIIMDKNDNSKILYEKAFNLKDVTSKNGSGNNFIIKEYVDIDYDEYNNHVNSFKRDYGLTVDSNLVVTMSLDVEGNYLENSQLAKTNNLSVVIPMSEQTIDISMKDDALNNSGKIQNNFEKKSISQITFFISGCLMGIAGLIVISMIVYLYLKNNKKDLYHATINKYLKDYDRIIITTKQPNVDERLFDEIIRVQDIKELVDLHDMSQKPIMYYEVIPNAKSYFIIISDRLLYKLTITKAWLERQLEESKTKNEK